MSPEEILKLIGELKQDAVPKVHASKATPKEGVLLADNFEILTLDKTSAKKLLDEELKSLVAYGLSYLDQYYSGSYMFKPGPWGMPMADLSEAGVFTEMSQVVAMLKAELNRRI